MANGTDTTNYHEWTSCEVYGHKFEDGSCTDCGEKDQSEDDQEEVEFQIQQFLSCPQQTIQETVPDLTKDAPSDYEALLKELWPPGKAKLPGQRKRRLPEVL
jgi:hypothetical protein